MKTFTLSDEQVQTAYTVAEKIKNSKSYTVKWDVNNIALGLLGETAYGLMTESTVNVEVWSDRGDGGADFLDGTDVKTISYTGLQPELKISKLPSAESKVKKYVLAICDIKQTPNTVHLVGEITSENFRKKATLRQHGNKFWYAVSPTELDVVYS